MAADETTTDGMSKEGSNYIETAQRGAQVKAAGAAKDDIAVQEGMKPGTLAAAAARAAQKRKDAAAKDATAPAPSPSPTPSPAAKKSSRYGRKDSSRA
jgi:hypothetical protein